MGSSHSSGSRRSSGSSLSRPNVHRQRTPDEQTLGGMLEAVFAVMEEPKGTTKMHSELDYYRVVVPYSRKYWRELNLAVEPEIAIGRILADLKFGGLVWDHHTYICE